MAQATAQRTEALECVKERRPLDAEPDMQRKINRIRSVTKGSPDVARAVATYRIAPSAAFRGEARTGAERIQGLTTDFVGVAFSDLARAASDAVARVVFRAGDPQGSGFMVSPRLFLTNNHVIPTEAAAAQFLAEFNYEVDGAGTAWPRTRFAFAPDVFFVTSAEDDLDFTLIAIGDRVDGDASLESFGSCPIFDSDDKHVIGEFVNIVQHPAGDYKQLVVRENRIVTRLDTVLHYVADTEPGSSGSPVFNDQWEAVALHHWGEPFTVTTTADGRPVEKDVNEGVRISAIVKALVQRRSSLSEPERVLLDAVLTTTSRRPSRTRLVGSTNLDRTEPHPAIDDGEGRFHMADEPKADTATGAVTHVTRIPMFVEVSVRVLPGAHATDGAGGRPDRAGPEAVTIDRRYENRRGYQANFLSGHDVPLPRLTNGLSQQAARLRQPPNDGNPYELKYERFSIVMNAQRRMAFFTAVNIDGRNWVDIDRDTGEPRESREAREKWFDDPRIEHSAQCDQSLYDDQRPRRIFDRGHLVRRQDPAQGSDASAIRANADTFHFTNCTPQESTFNQRAQYWQGIENYILDNAKAERRRVTVFTGPVFDDDDPPYRYIQVPMAFWKVLVRVDGGSLKSTALVASQSDRIGRLPERIRGEAFDNMGRISEYQTSVREIERLTGLDFGVLRDRDTFRPDGPEGFHRPFRALRGFADVRLDR